MVNPFTLTCISWMVFLVMDVALSVCPRGMVGRKRMEYAGRCFESNMRSNEPDRVSWEDASSICQKYGGQLAKLTEDGLEKLMSSQTSSLVQCHWLGLTDIAEEGKWKWVDGSPATDIRWEPKWQNFFTKFDWDCGMVCQEYSFKSRSMYATWESGKCHIPKYFLCEYAALPPKSAPIRTRPVRRQKALTFQKLKSKAFVPGAPVHKERAHFITMCIRSCLGKCLYFNYNTKTKMCRGFGDIDQHALTSDEKYSDWQLWSCNKG